MSLPGFSFSVGDFIAGGQVLIEVISAFKEAGGASSKYASEVSFLNSLKTTLDHLEKFVKSSSSRSKDNLPQDIAKLLQEIREPWEEFKKFLDKYEPSLGASSSKSKLGKAPRTIQYTVKDISGKVEKLRRQTEQPLQAVNSLLSLHVIKSLEKLPEQLLQPAQCAQLVEAITLADIPSELDKQIRELKLAADEHNIKQDEQLQIITTLRAQLEERITGLQEVLDEVKDTTARETRNKSLFASITADTRVDQLSNISKSKTDQLDSAVKEQKQLILALKSFLEDKASGSEATPKFDDEGMAENEKKRSWPSATLSTAYFAALMLSSVLSSVATTSAATRKQRNSGGALPVFLPVDYSLPGLGPLNKTRIQSSPIRRLGELGISQSGARTMASSQKKETAKSAPAKPKISDPATASEWLEDYSRTQRALRQPDEQPYRSKGPELEGFSGYSMGAGRSRETSKLNTPGKDDRPDEDHDVGSGSDGIDDGGLHDGPGPAIPTVDDDNEVFDWGNIGFSSGRGGYNGSSDSDSDSS